MGPEWTVYKLYKIQGYSKAIPELDRLEDCVIIHVIADSENEAIEKARQLVTSVNYRVAEVTELFYDHRFSAK